MRVSRVSLAVRPQGEGAAMAIDEEIVWPPPPEGEAKQAQFGVKSINTALGRTAFCFSGLGALAWLIMARFNVYSVSEGGWVVLTFGGLASLLLGLVIGLFALRSGFGKAGVIISLLMFFLLVVDLFRHPFNH